MGSILILILLLAFTLFLSVVSQELNTDGFFLSDFMQKMGAKTSVISSSTSTSSSGSPSYSVCSWEGVLCDAREENVVGLTASGKGLSGVIPETTIAKLTMLQVLDLSNNNITSFSADFWSLGATLRTLNLSYNQVTGALPSNIGNFGTLETLDLSFNGLIGEVPETISALSRLRVLKLRGNGLGGGIPLGILNCKNLMKLDLSMNRLNGTVPFGFGAGLTKLRSLDLAGNEIRGRSFDLSGLKSLSYLNISMNLFQGSVKGVFLESGALEVIDLSRNQFWGHISQVHGFFNLSRLVFLDISENQISGKFFDNFNDARNLKHLNLARNRFSKQHFPQIHKFSSLEYLNMSKTSLVGEIPIEITRLSSLTTLDLSGNRLVGRIPRLYNPNLQVLDLSFNNLTGHVSLSLLERLARMKRFNLSYNNLTLCGTNFSLRTYRTAFIGALNNCPIAVNPNVPGRKTNRSRGLQLYLVIAFSVTSFVVGLIILAFACRRKTTKWEVKQHSYREETNISGPFSFHAESTTWVADVKNATSVPVVIFEKPLLNFTFADLLAATSHFDRGTLLAEGRFGPVYRGYLAGGIHVAVKVLVSGSTLTDQEAARELEYLGGVKHPNLVPLTGYCIAGDQRIAIYEYMDNGNLQNFLHDLPLGVQTTEDWSTDTWEEDRNVDIQHVGSEGLLLTWTFRCKVALGVARALAFLHHGCSPPIIHRDVKASSVYLDSDLEPRLSDFGLAKIFGNGLEERLARGTPGYAPPEFSGPENVTPTPKSDVYGFGVVLFELITGKKPIGDDYPDSQDSNLVDWVRGLVRKKQSSRAIDPKILGTAPENHLEEALRIGYLCTADLPTKRPTMQQIVGLLKDIEPAQDL